MNKYNILKNEIITLRNEINLLKTQIDEIKRIKNDIIINDKSNDNNKVIDGIMNDNKSKDVKKIYFSNPESITFSNIITKDSYTGYVFDNSISVFKSIYDIYLLFYSNKNKSIISYDLMNNQILKELKNAHDSKITNIRHYFDSLTEEI